MIVLTLTDWPIINGSIQESGLFYIFQIIRSYLQSKHIDRIGLHLHTKDMLFYMLLNTKTLIILLHLDDSRRKNIDIFCMRPEYAKNGGKIKYYQHNSRQ